MGSWGTGLYSSDTALDILSLISTVLKVPKSIDDLIRTMYSEIDNDENDQAITFWLVLADQFEKKGIRHEKTFNEAISILKNAADIEELKNLNVQKLALEQRKKYNEKLLFRLTNPRPEKLRIFLKKPQINVIKSGDIITFPTQNGQSRNPYFPAGKEPFKSNGWGLAKVYLTGHELDYLSWVSLCILPWPHRNRPSFEEAAIIQHRYNLKHGTLSKSHFRKMQINILGNTPTLYNEKPPLQGNKIAKSVALNGICISNALI